MNTEKILDLLTENVDRIEVIDTEGRLLVIRNVTLNLSLQDDERTLKIFVGKRPVKKVKCINCLIEPANDILQCCEQCEFENNQAREREAMEEKNFFAKRGI